MWIGLLFAVSAPALAPFGYEAHGADWQDGTCASRTAQSPVNLANIFGKPSGTFEVNYGEPLTSFDVVNDGEQLVARVAPGGRGVVVNGQSFDLVEVGFHAPAEHTLGAHRPALEVQLRHTKAGSPRRVHVSILFDAPAPVALVQQTPREIARLETEAEVRDVDYLTAASALDATLREPPVNKTVYAAPLATDAGYALGLAGVLAQELPLPQAEASVQEGSWDLGALVSGEFYSYTGSMTVPPCTENVQWLVSRVATPASADQLERFRRALQDIGEGGNWRIVMPFNQRPVEVLRMAKRVAPVQPSPALAKEDAEREFVAKRNAQDAVTIAQYMRGYARDVDQELRTSTIAHLKEFLAPSPTPAPTPPPSAPAPMRTLSKSWYDPVEQRRALTSGAMNAVREAARRMAEEAATGLHMATNLSAFGVTPPS